MGPEKQAVKCYLLGEAADVAALFLTWEKELGDPRLTEPLAGLPSGPFTAFWGLTEIWSVTGIFQSHYFIQESGIWHRLLWAHRAVPAAAVSSKLLNILVLVGPG